jgi:hypothetical protein
MRFRRRLVTAPLKQGETIAGDWFVSKVGEDSYGVVEVSLCSFSPHHGLIRITLRTSPTFDIRKFVTDCLDNYPLGDLRTDRHSLRAVGQRGASVNG